MPRWMLFTCVVLVLAFAIFQLGGGPGGETPLVGTTGETDAPQDAPGALPETQGSSRAIETDAQNRLEVEVFDSGGAPIADAEVKIGDFHSEDSLIVMTNSVGHGAAELVDLAAEDPDYLTVSKSGFRTREVSIPEDAELIQVVLTRVDEIHGQLLFPGNEKPGPGVSVLASPGVPAKSVEEFLASPDVIFCTADGSGRFQLTGLDPNKSYSITAGGLGLLEAEAGESTVRPGAEGLRIPMLWAKAVQVKYREEDDSPVHLPTTLQLSRLVGATAPRSLQRSYAFSLSAVLAGVSPSIREDPSSSTLLFKSTNSEPSRIEISGEVPGYEPVEAEVWLRTIESSFVHQETVPLIPTSKGRGRLNVELKNDLLASFANEHLHPIGQVQFRSSAGTWFQLSLSAATTVIDDLPYGTYELFLSLEPNGVLASLPCDRVIEIGPEPTTATWDLSEMGALQVQIPDLDDPSRGFDVSITFLDRVDGEEMQSGPIPHAKMTVSRTDFLGAPYIVQALPAGTHYIAVHKNAPTRMTGIEIRAGELTTVQVPVAELQ